MRGQRRVWRWLCREASPPVANAKVQENACTLRGRQGGHSCRARGVGPIKDAAEIVRVGEGEESEWGWRGASCRGTEGVRPTGFLHFSDVREGRPGRKDTRKDDSADASWDDGGCDSV